MTHTLRSSATTTQPTSARPRTGATPLSSLPFALDTPDAALPPSFVATSAYRLRAIDARRFHGPESVREPFLELVDSLHVGPSRFAVTSRLAVRGDRAEPVIEADLILAALGDEGVGDELTAVDRHLTTRFFGPGRVFAAERLPVERLRLPTSGDGSLIRQSTIAVGHETASLGVEETVLPVRFAWPGPWALPRLLGALTAAGPGTDLFVTVCPTALREGERAQLERARAAAARSDDLTQLRDAATALDAVLSFRTEVSVVQILLVTRSPLPEVTRRLVATALTASFDTQPQHGHRIVAAPQRFVGGGCSIEPCRDVDEMLARLHYGLPMIGFPNRTAADLVTATEIAYCLGWATDEAGALPGVAESSQTAPPFDTTSGWTLGHDPLGHEAGVAVRDRCLHTVFIGGSGSGKTTLFAGAIRDDLARGHTAVVIDPHGDLLARAVADVPPERRDRVYLLDAAAGLGDRLNLLRLSDSPARREVQAAAVVEGSVADLNKDFAGPVFHEVVPPLLGVLGDLGATLTDIQRYLHDPDALERAAHRTGRDDALALAAEMRSWNSGYRGEIATWARSKFHWAQGDGVRTSLCSTEPTFELDDALAPGGLLLVHPGDDPTSGALLSSVLLSVLLASFSDRNLGSPPLSIYLDEVQRFSGNVVRRAMNEARKRAVALHLATQNLTNVSGEFEALLGNAGHLVLGRAVGPTAAFAEHHLGIPAASVSRLPNLRAFCRLSPGGQPAEPFTLEIEAPRGGTALERPDWLDRLIEARWASARLEVDD